MDLSTLSAWLYSMDAARGSVYAAVALIAAVTIISGPLVGAVDLTYERGSGITDDIGSGSADVVVHSLPESATISEGRYGSQTVYLRVPDARITLSNVTGQPLLKYDLDIPELGFSTGTTTFVTERSEGRKTLSIPRKTFDASEIERDRYEATVSILVRADGNTTVVDQRSMNVEVKQ